MLRLNRINSDVRSKGETLLSGASWYDHLKKRQAAAVWDDVLTKETIWQPTLPEMQEVWRRLYARLFSNSNSAHPRVLAFSGVLRGDGSTTNAIGLAVTMASDLEKKILLVDCDLSQPSIGSAFGLPSSQGLAEYLRGQCEFDAALRQTDLENLWLLPAGSGEQDHSKLVRGSRANALLSSIRDGFDLAILDLPPVMASSDCEVMMPLADYLVLVVRAAITPSDTIARAVGLIGEERTMGIVMNGARSAIPGWLQRFL